MTQTQTFEVNGVYVAASMFIGKYTKLCVAVDYMMAIDIAKGLHLHAKKLGTTEFVSRLYVADVTGILREVTRYGEVI